MCGFSFEARKMIIKVLSIFWRDYDLESFFHSSFSLSKELILSELDSYSHMFPLTYTHTISSLLISWHYTRISWECDMMKKKNLKSENFYVFDTFFASWQHQNSWNFRVEINSVGVGGILNFKSKLVYHHIIISRILLRNLLTYEN